MYIKQQKDGKKIEKTTLKQKIKKMTNNEAIEAYKNNLDLNNTITTSVIRGFMLFQTIPDVIFGASVISGKVTVGDIIHLYDNTGTRYILGFVVDIQVNQQYLDQVDNTDQDFAIKITNGALVESLVTSGLIDDENTTLYNSIFNV